MGTPAQITSADELVTPIAEIVKGFLVQARIKRVLARQKVSDGRRFEEALRTANSTTEIIGSADMRTRLIAAAGFSQKSHGHIRTQPQMVDRELRRFLEDVAARAGNDWHRDVLYRFLLTAGATLDGSSKNAVGKRAKRKLSRALWRTIKTAHRDATVEKEGAEIKSISWDGRKLLFDVNCPFTNTNVDAILLGGERRLEVADDYIACGELKGGIDPAGGDEHWKTALSALNRLRTSGQMRRDLKLFFVGASMGHRIAREVYTMLQGGSLERAANLTCRWQMDALTNWVSNL